MDTSFKGKRILVTGGGGFVGAHLVARLAEHGSSDVFVPRSRDFDLTQQAAARKVFDDARPDLVFHLAARRPDGGRPASTLRDNLAMALNVLEEARRAGTPKVVTTAAAAGDSQALASAMVALGRTYRQEFGSRFVMLFPPDLYGPGDNFDADTGAGVSTLIRTLTDAADQRTKEVVLAGGAPPNRALLYVEDAVDALIRVALEYEGTDPLKLDPGSDVSLAELAETIARVAGYAGAVKWDTSAAARPAAPRVEGKSAKDAIGFVPGTPLEDGLRATVDSYRARRAQSGAVPKQKKA